MPYKSEAQRRFFNSPAGKAKLGEEEVEHWNEASEGMDLPEKAIDRAINACDKELPGQISIWDLPLEGQKPAHTGTKKAQPDKPIRRKYLVHMLASDRNSSFPINETVEAYSPKQAIAYVQQKLRKEGYYKFVDITSYEV